MSPYYHAVPRVLECGCCLIGGVKFVEFLCQNVGVSAGTFCIVPKNQWPASNLRCLARTHFSEQPPFAISPSLFVLQPGEVTVVEVVFFPTAAEKSCEMFTIVCDNCQVKDISIEGEGQLIALELVSVSGRKEPPVVGEVHDLTAEHLVRFSPCNPHSVQEKRLIIRNNVHLELPFHWQTMKPNLHPQLPGETPEPKHIQFHPTTDGVFHVTPITGVLPPCQEQEFLFTFCPKESHGISCSPTPNMRKYDHITPILKSLHWLPVELRIEFKVSVLTHQCIYGTAPPYLKELLTPLTSVRTNRSSNSNLLKPPRTKLRTMGDRAFCSAAPSLWNALPDHMRASQTVESFSF
ncbi:deleted in lung and esophageal cancer protein 1-like [Notothenia coriiceps]|uniref:Deleted in lung and esophageal cancer protein 1-like n=1 Tax=Notothenia coriiceps TaxID=8208 RepID=A0A6I9PXQ8_9TELE|nr:PREDICTED: deleted in lung and esophageal cancer protein 1-like [Notothenia coriiceps]